MISNAYENADIWAQEKITLTETELVLRPERTPSTYAYMNHLLDSHSGTKPPLCVWQAGRSYRHLGFAFHRIEVGDVAAKAGSPIRKPRRKNGYGRPAYLSLSRLI
jgi:hypothetical protein